MSKSPAGLIIGAMCFVLTAAILAAVFGGPIVAYWKQRTADAEAGQEHALDAGEASALEVEGTNNLVAESAAYRGAVVIIREQAHELELETRADVDAETILPPGVRDRIARGDGFLCDSGVECRHGSGPAPAGDPGGGPDALHSDGDAG